MEVKGAAALSISSEPKLATPEITEITNHEKMSSVSASEENKQDHDSENNCCSPTGPLQPPLKRTDQADMGLDIPVEPKASSYHKVPHEGHGTISSNGRPSLPL